jgi:pantothenate kinase type III
MPGANTVDAIAAGVDRGSVGAVLELLAATRALFPGRELRALACGGDARFFLDSMPGVFEDGGADFTLRGLLLAWELRDS